MKPYDKEQLRLQYLLAIIAPDSQTLVPSFPVVPQRHRFRAIGGGGAIRRLRGQQVFGQIYDFLLKVQHLQVRCEFSTEKQTQQ